MASRRASRITTIVVLIAALAAVWWSERNGGSSSPVDPPTPTVTLPGSSHQPPPRPEPRPGAATRRGPPPSSVPSVSSGGSEGSASGSTDGSARSAPEGPAELSAAALSWITDPDERAAVAYVATAIDRGGPFKYRKDGAVFENREQRLPAQPRWCARPVPEPSARDAGLAGLALHQRAIVLQLLDTSSELTNLHIL